MVRRFVFGVIVSGGLALGLATAQDQGAPPASEVSYEEVQRGEFDPLSVPVDSGIVWYGTWEDAMAEKQRTGKPVMLHMGSPRCASAGVKVPGTW